MKKKSKSNLSNIILVVILIIGVSLLLYPSVSDYWNSLHASKAISNYAENVESMDSVIYEKILQDAYNYNKLLLKRGNDYELDSEQKDLYYQTLDISKTGIMGYVEIPGIDLRIKIS